MCADRSTSGFSDMPPHRVDLIAASRKTRAGAADRRQPPPGPGRPQPDADTSSSGLPEPRPAPPCANPFHDFHPLRPVRSV